LSGYARRRLFYYRNRASGKRSCERRSHTPLNKIVRIPMNEFKGNPWWIFWGICIALLSLLFYNLFGFKNLTLANKQLVEAGAAEARTIDKSPVNVIGIDSSQMIRFTQKTVCRRNVQYINMMVEMWYIKHDGVWPKTDLSDIGRDIDYFPSGLPTCPVDGSHYRLNPKTFRIAGHDHSEITMSFDEAKPRKKPIVGKHKDN
jgi:hypothetical protein